MKFYASCTPLKPAFPFGAYWPHPAHRDVLIRALSQIGVDTTTTPEGLIHFLTADRATCITFSDNDLHLRD